MLRNEHASQHMKGHKYGIGNKNGSGNKGKVTWNKGKKLDLKGRLKLSLSHKGQIPWSKGLKGVQVPWNKGKKKIFFNNGKAGMILECYEEGSL